MMNLPLKTSGGLLLSLFLFSGIAPASSAQHSDTAIDKPDRPVKSTKTNKSAKSTKSTEATRTKSTAKAANSKKTASNAKSSGHKLDHSGRTRKGKASYYARKFYGRTMADGTKMNPQSNVAASKTLPLGTKAEVTNLENGKSAVVEIKDRGPYVDGRIIDLSPKTADKLDIKEQGVAPVAVTPVEVPQPDGSVKSGAGNNSSGQ